MTSTHVAGFMFSPIPWIKNRISFVCGVMQYFILLFAGLAKKLLKVMHEIERVD
jgi:hypothetical protein